MIFSGFAGACGDLPVLPETARVLLTAHDAFNYFGEAYGFEVVGIQGISTESEAGLNRISTLVDVLVSRNIGAVFVESSVSDRNMRALIEGAAARGHEVTALFTERDLSREPGSILRGELDGVGVVGGGRGPQLDGRLGERGGDSDLAV